MNNGILPLPTNQIEHIKGIGTSDQQHFQPVGHFNNSLDWKTSTSQRFWSRIQESIKVTTRQNNFQSSVLSSSRYTVPNAANAGYIGATIISNGKIFAHPFNATSAGIYDTNNDTWTSLGSFVGAGAFIAGTILPDNRIFMCPRGSQSCRIVDVDNKIITTPSAVFPGGAFSSSCCAFDDGWKIFFAPATSSSTSFYDVKKDTLTACAGTYSTDGVNPASAHCFLLPDGRIFICPRYASTPYIYDPYKNSLLVDTALHNINFAFSCACMINDEEILIVPAVSTYGVRYNYKKRTSYTVGSFAAGSDVKYGGAIPCQDGKILIFPTNGTGVLSFDPITNRFTTINGTSSYTGFGSMILLQDGRIVLIPRVTTFSTVSRFLGTKGSRTFDPNIQLSQWYNRR